MPDEIGWPTDEEEAALDRASAIARAAMKLTAADRRELERDIAEARKLDRARKARQAKKKAPSTARTVDEAQADSPPKPTKENPK